ncbi:MAG: hypothetical protein NTV01_07635, partial [Bacteroidia bacterium]|nr:hypothetical protein [Bacteroidia bacterium]
MKNSEPKSAKRRFNPFRYSFLKLTLVALMLAMPAIVSAQCTLMITNPAAVCSPNTVDITKAAITAGSDAGLSFSYWTNAGATVALASPGAVAASGIYYIRAVNVSGCINIKPVAVIVNPAVLPTFAPIGPLCQNSAAPALPTTSINGITGTWSPATLSTAIPGIFTFTFTPSAGQCATTFVITVTVRNLVIPVFAAIGPFCPGSAPPVLPAVSTNGVAGTWSPAVISTSAIGFYTYTFTPAAGECSIGITMTVVVTDLVVPVFAAMGPYCVGTTPDALPATSINGIT